MLVYISGAGEIIWSLWSHHTTKRKHAGRLKHQLVSVKIEKT